MSLARNLADLRRIEKLLEIRDKRLDFAIDVHRNSFGKKLNFDSHYLHDLYYSLSPEIVLQASIQCGKFLANSCPVHTPNGWVRNGDIRTGDYVTSVDGTGTKVIGVYPQGKQPLYTLTFDDGRTVEAGLPHLWEVSSVKTSDYQAEILTTQQILFQMGNENAIFRVPAIGDDSGGPTIVEIAYSHDEESTCIAVDHPRRLYVIKDYLVTHNTEWMLVDHFATAASGLSLYYVLPKFMARNQFVQNRVDRTIAHCPEYQKLSSRDANITTIDSCALKTFGGSTILYAGSNSEADFRSNPADAFYVDEVQHCDANNLRLLADRLEASNYRFKRWAGNPKFPASDINAEFLLSDQQHWHVPCKYCRKLSKLDWFDTIVKAIVDKEGNHIRYELRDKEWEPTGFRDIHALCPLCDGVLSRLGGGKWVAENPGALREGFLMNKLMTGKSELGEMWRDFNAALHSPSAMQWFYSSTLGLPYLVPGGRVTVDLLDDCAIEDPFVVYEEEAFIANREHPGPCSMGIDPGKLLDVRISYPHAGKRQAVFVGKVSNKEEIFILMRKFNVQVCIMDERPELQFAAEVQADAPCDVWTCSYSQSEGMAAHPRFNTNTMRVRVDRTFALDQGLNELRIKRNTLPKNVRELIGGRYADEMTAPMRVLEQTADGNNRYEWRCVNAAVPDHQRHADAYDSLAAECIHMYDNDSETGVAGVHIFGGKK